MVYTHVRLPVRRSVQGRANFNTLYSENAPNKCSLPMKAELEILIDRFRAAQDIGVDTFVRDLELPLPASGRHWFEYCHENGIYKLQDINGVGIYAHGYGVELKIGKLTIDFDWGPNGEVDGFDGWRLYNFTLDNETSVKCTHLDVNAWIDDAHGAGELIKNGDLYFDPKRRAAN